MKELDIIHLGDAKEVLSTLPDKSVDCCVTSPPYYALRDYGVEGQLGLEPTPEEYISKLADIFDEVYRVLKDDGTLWVNIGDSYFGGGWRGVALNQHSGEMQKAHKGTIASEGLPALRGRLGDLKPKDLIGIPFMLAFELRRRGWYLRQDIIWAKKNVMPESVTDRCTKSHEYIFLLSKSKKYYFDHKAIQEESTSAETIKTMPKFGGSKYGKNTDRIFRKYGGQEWRPQTKNCQPKGQTPNSFHVSRELGEPDKEYYVRNKRDVWSVATEPSSESHIAMYPTKLIAPCILAGCRRGGVVLDPFMGSGTTALVAKRLERHFIGVELNPRYKKIADRRIWEAGISLFEY